LAPLANFTVWTDNKNLSILFRKKCLLPNLSMQWFKAFLNVRFLPNNQASIVNLFVHFSDTSSPTKSIRYFTQMKLNLNFSWVGNNFCQLFFSARTKICRDDAWTSIPPASLSVFSLPIFSVSPSVCLSIFNVMFLYTMYIFFLDFLSLCFHYLFL
jgi:hypothetical protein